MSPSFRSGPKKRAIAIPFVLRLLILSHVQGAIADGTGSKGRDRISVVLLESGSLRRPFLVLLISCNIARLT